MKRLCILIVSAALSLGCATRGPSPLPVTVFKTESKADATNRVSMIGRWYGEAKLEGGGDRIWLAERFPDGQFKIEFILRMPSGTEKQTEVGFWGVSANIYFTITKGWLEEGLFSPANPEDASFYDAYEILELTEDEFRYRHFSTGGEYTLRRVSSDFVFPPTSL